MARRVEVVQEKFVCSATTWLTRDDADRLDAVAVALGWTNSQFLRWAFRQSIEHAEERARALAASAGKPASRPKGR